MHLTNKQLLRSKKLFGPNCKAFFPCDEGSGTSITDIMNGVTIVDSGMTWADAHGAKCGEADYDNAANYNLIDIKDKYLLMVHVYTVVTSAAFGIFSLNNKSAPTRIYSLSAGSGALVNDSSGAATSAAFSANASAGQVQLLAMTFDPVTGVLNSYDAENGATPALVNTDTANAARLALDGGLYDYEIVINTDGAFSQITHGTAVFAFANGLPSDIVDALSHFNKYWPLGRKEGWADWVNLA